ncbi:Ig-like domain-containing alpha-2-macroglobulin family protein [Longimonas halophila]|nr:Ig-like domain-containing alpha-2-macroglobulin family protein [Longimonas halophila]
MSLRFDWPVLLGGLLLGLFFVGCGGSSSSTSEAPDSLSDRAVTERFTPTLDGPLRLLSVSPRGTRTRYQPRQAITATFSQPMVALGDTEAPPDSALSVEPAVEGSFRWEGTQTLVFTPNDDLPPATEFTVTVHPVLESTEGEAMQEPYTWTFETVRPQIVSTTPSDGERFAPLDQSLRLRFNLPVDATATQRFLDSDRLPIGLAENDGDSTLVLPLSTELAQGTEYTLTAAAGLPTTAGPLGTADTTRIQFRTYPPLALQALDQSSWQYPDDQGRFAPDQGLTLLFSTPVRFGDLRAAFSMEPAIEWPPGTGARDGYTSTEHTISVPLQAETDYTLRIENLTDRFGQSLPATERTFETRAYSPSLQVPDGAMLVESNQERALPVRYVNVTEARIGAEVITRDEIVPAYQTYDRSYREEAEDPVPIQRTWTLDESRTEHRTTSLRFDSLLTSGQGIVGWQLNYDRTSDGPDTHRGLAQYTDLGLTAKFSPHQSLLLVTTLDQAEPVADAAVEIRSRDNRVLWTGTTGADGRADFPGWTELLDDPGDGVPDLFAIVEHEGDLAFTSSEYGSGIRAYRFGIQSSWRPEPVTRTGTIFTDRGLYKAGDTVHIKGILRSRTDRDWQPITDSLRMVVHDPRDEVVLDEQLTASDLGSFDTTWRAPRGAAQGDYDVQVGLVDDTTLTAERRWDREGIASGTFQIESFRQAAFTVEASSAADAYVAGDFFEGTLSARYLFGAGLPGASAFLRVRQSSTRHQPPGYDDYQFGPMSGYEYSTLLEQDTTLSADSDVSVRVPTAGNADGHPMRLTWTGRVTDASQQEIAGRTTTMVHPGQFYIGMKPSTSYLDMSETDELTVDLITVDPNGRPEGDHEVTVELVRKEWNSVREVGSDGRMTWRSEETEVPVADTTLTSQSDTAQRAAFTIPQGGLYEVRATATDIRGNALKTEATVYASGSGYVAWQREDDDQVELVTDQDTYAPGETARIMVPSPFEEATALITIERDGILHSRVETLTGSAPQIEIDIEDDYLPNVYASVILLNERTAPPQATADPGAPAFRVGYVELPVDASERRISVDIEPNTDTYRPGETVTVDMQLRDDTGQGVPGEITFSAADAGVLNLIGYALPDPFNTFYGTRPLSVTTTETRSAIVKQRTGDVVTSKAQGLGGGGGEESVRTDFTPLAHWDPAVQTDAQGRAQLSFELPEQLTTMRLMATAHTPTHQFGNGQTDITVTKPLVLQSGLPRFIHEGDTFEARVLLTNRTDTEGTAEVQIDADSLTLPESTTQTVTLAPGATEAVTFRAEAPAADTARVAFRAQMNGETDALRIPLPITRSTTTDVQATFASTESTATETLRPRPDRVSGTGQLDVRLASTALTGLDGALEHLFTYPYGCIEQQTSRIRPLLLAPGLVDAFGLALPFDNRDAAIAEWRDELSRFWTGDGFAMWPGSSTAQPYLTGYVALALAEAKEAGVDVPQPLTENALDALEEWVRNPSDRPDYYSSAVWADTRALMLYALARHGRVVTSELSVLADNPPASPDGLSYLLRALHTTDSAALASRRDAIADRLRAQIRVESTQAYLAAPDDNRFGWIFASDARATAFGLSALLTHDASSDFQPLAQRMVQYLVDERTQGHWTSTQDNAAVVEAFDRYVEAYEAETPDFAATVELAGREILAAAFRTRTLDTQRTTVPESDLPDGETPLRIQKDDGPGRLYYTARLETATTAPVEAREQGLRVERTLELLDTDGEVARTLDPNADGTRQIAEGSLVRVTLRLNSPTDRNYVVVDDPLPAGLETLNSAFETTDTGLLRDADTGQDRWWGSFNHTEQQDTRVLLFADYLRRGTHTYRYVARATTSGTFVHPAVEAELMYRPETRGRTATGRLVVE